MIKNEINVIIWLTKGDTVIVSGAIDQNSTLEPQFDFTEIKVTCLDRQDVSKMGWSLRPNAGAGRFSLRDQPKTQVCWRELLSVVLQLNGAFIFL